MNDNPGKHDIDDAELDEQYTDTSIFDTEEIVRNVEEGARRAKKEKQAQSKIDARRRAEIRREQQMLDKELQDLEGFEVEEWDGQE